MKKVRLSDIENGKKFKYLGKIWIKGFSFKEFEKEVRYKSFVCEPGEGNESDFFSEKTFVKPVILIN